MSNAIMSAVGNTGGPIPIELNGRTYHIHAWTDALRAKFTRWAHKYVLDRLRKLRDSLTPAEYTQQFNQLTADIVDGEYDFGGNRLARLTETDDGVRVLVTVLLNEDLVTDEEIDALIINRMSEIFAALRQLNPEPEAPVKPGEQST